MKKTTTILIFYIILTLIFSGCSSNSLTKVNKKFTGQSEHWTVYYNIKGHTDVKFDGKRTYKDVTDGSYHLEIKYNGDSDDLQSITQFEVEGPNKINYGITSSNDPTLISKMLIKQGVPSSYDLLYYYYTDEFSITIKWKGKVSQEETIILK